MNLRLELTLDEGGTLAVIGRDLQPETAREVLGAFAALGVEEEVLEEEDWEE